MLVFETTTTANPAEPPPPIGFQPDYFRSIPGILKITELVLSIIVLICVAVNYFRGAGWVEFVAIQAMFITIFFLIIYGINFRKRISNWFTLVELVYFCLITLFYFIAAIISAVKAGVFASAGAACFFCFAATAVFAYDAFQTYRVYKVSQAASDSQNYKSAPTTADPPPYEEQQQY